MSADGMGPVQGIGPPAVPPARPVAETQSRMEIPDPPQNDPPPAEITASKLYGDARQLPRPDLSPLTNAIPPDTAAMAASESETDILPLPAIEAPEDNREEYRDLDSRRLVHDFLDNSTNDQTPETTGEVIAELQSLREALLNEIDRVDRILAALGVKAE